MKKILIVFLLSLAAIAAMGQGVDTLSINEVTVVSFYRNSINTGSVIDKDDLISSNYGQEPSHLFTEMPSIFSLSDNGTDFGYGYFRIRGLDQTRINVTLDGCPWNEAEDFGTYFANSPDLMSSLKSIKVERGSSSSYNGVAGSAGGINMESVDLYDLSRSYAYLGAGSYNTYKASLVYNMLPCNGWGLHVKATHQQTDGFREFGFNSSQAITVKTGYKFNDRHSIDFLTINGFHRNGQGWLGNTYEELKSNPRANGCTEAEDDNWFMSMNRLLYKGRISDNIILTSSLYGQFQTGSYRMDLDNYMRRMVDPSWLNTGMIYDYGLNHHLVGSNIYAKFFLNKFTITAGMNGYTYKRNHFMGNKCINIPTEEYYSNFGRKNEFSGLLNISYKPHKKVTISGNVQYRSVAFIYRDTEKYGNPYGNQSFDKNWEFVNFGGNVEYSPINIMKIYSRFNYLNREPTRSDMLGGNEFYMGELATTTPEIAKDLEVGTEFNYLNKLNFNINAFYMWFDNELILNGEYGPNGLPCHENAEDSFRRGLEMTLHWNIFSNLHYTLNGSLSQNRVKSTTFGNKVHVLSPSATSFTELAWKAPLWEIGTSVTYRSKMYVDMANEYKLPYSMSFDAYAKVKLHNMEICVMLDGIGPVDNLDFCTGMVGANGEMLYIQNSPFYAMASVKYFF